MKCNYNGCSIKCKGDIDVGSCNVLRAYNHGAREFAEWLMASYITTDIMGNRVWTEEALAEWQKGN